MDGTIECEFWNSEKFWNTDIPIFSPCFRNTLLRWIPCAFLILSFLLQIKSYFKRYSDETVNFVFHIKRLLIVLLIIGSFIELGYFNNFDYGPVFVFKTASTCLEIVTYILIVLLFIRPRNKLRTSCVLVLYSFISVIFSIIRVYSAIVEYYHYRGLENDVERTDNSYLIYLIIYLALISLFFIFNCYKDSRLPTDKINCPIYYSSFLSRATFWWMNALIKKGFNNVIKEDELHELHYSNKTNYLYARFNRFYRKKLEKKCEKENEPSKPSEILLDENGNIKDPNAMKNGIINNNYIETEDLKKVANGLNNTDKVNGSKPKDDLDKSAQNIQPPQPNPEYLALLNKPPNVNLVGPLFKTFWKEMIVVAIFRLAALCIQFINPLILDSLLYYMNSKGPIYEGVFYGIGMFCVMLSFSLFNNQYEFRISVLGMKIRSVLTMAIYKKILALSSTGKHKYATGEIVNLMGADCERIFEFIVIANQSWACVFQILVSLAMIYYKLGLGFLGALAVLAIVIPWNTFITRKLKQYQSIEMSHKDERVNILSEILNGIKCLKLYSWEHSFKSYLMVIRSKEMVYLKKKLIMQICMIQSYTLIPFLIIFFCLLVHILAYPEEILDANKAFVTISLVNILKTPLGLLPFVFSNGVMAKIAIKRINKFLSEDELDINTVERTNNSQARDAVSMKNASFIWDVQTDVRPVLKKIHMKVRRKQLVAVVGSVASGKSSLLAALLGEMHKIKGQVNINGSVAYVSQQAWVLNQTLKDNIVFGNEFDQKKYLDVLSKCQLLPDLKLLAAGDETEIGEKGINLSGGQKQRVNIARAVYADKDIYLFDDPLSALDSNVGKEVFDKVIGPNGLLKNKTRILVTHRVSLLPKVDRIIVLKNGMISEVGSYSDLMKTKGDFAEFILQHLENEEFDLENIDNQEYQDMQQIRTAVRSSMNLPVLDSNPYNLGPGSRPNSKPGSRHGSRQNSFRRKKSISSTKSICLNCKSQNQTCYNCERLRHRRERTESMSSRKSVRRNSITSITKSFTDEFDRESIINDDDEDAFIDDGKDKNKLTEAEKIKSGGIFGKACMDYLVEFKIFAFVMVVVFYTLAYVFNYNCSIWLQKWADDSKNEQDAKDPYLRNYRIGIYLLFGLLESTFVLFSMMVLSKGCLKAAQNVHNIMLENISCSPSWYFDSTPLGRIVNRFAKDMEVLNFTVWMNLRSFFNSMLKAITSLLIVSTHAPITMVLIFPLLILYYIFQLVYIRTKRQLVRINFASKSPIYSIYQETILGSTPIRAFNLEDEFANSCAEKIDQNSISFLPTYAVARWLTMRLEFLGNIIVFICTIFMTLNRDDLSPALVGLAITSALTINNSMNNFVRICSDLENNIVSIERCIEYTDLEKEDNVPDERSNLGKWPENGNVKFIDYSTKYRPHLDYVLNNVSCDIEPKQKIGVVGRTGAGKSSLTLALFRIIEAYNGSIQIDGRNISELGLYELRSRLTIIPQEPSLFTGTLRLNLDPLSIQAKEEPSKVRCHTDSELWSALEQAHLKEFVQLCPGGLDFVIQEGGENLSVGQRQLVCLARALLRKSKILVLDEATAAVDIETDELIQATIRKQFADCTIITIAHRLNTVMDYDKIIVLDRGRIAEFDSVENLLANKNSIFRSMAQDSGLVSSY